MYKIIFAWTPDFSVNYLKALLNDNRFEIVKIITQEDKKIWRKQELSFPLVKKEWLKHWIEVLQPKTKEEITEIIKKEKPDFFVVIAYWKILPKESLEIAKYNINIHWSILPKYRWASPIQSAILNWEKETWISVMNIEEKMDAWSVWKIHKCKINKFDTSSDIFDKLSKMSEFFPDDLDDIFQWKLEAKKQNKELATYCKKIKKEEWEIDFKNENAKNIFLKLNAFTPWPWIWTEFIVDRQQISEKFLDARPYADRFRTQNLDFWKKSKFWISKAVRYKWKKIKIIKADYQYNKEEKYKIWEVFKDNWEIFIQTKNWILELIEVQLEWKKSSKILDFINGQKDFIWNVFS